MAYEIERVPANLANTETTETRSSIAPFVVAGGLIALWLGGGALLAWDRRDTVERRWNLSRGRF